MRSKHFLIRALLFFVVFVVCAPSYCLSATCFADNIILDDLGWSDVGFHRGGPVRAFPAMCVAYIGEQPYNAKQS